MRRWAITLLCGLSLLIFLLAMGIWVRSYFVCDILKRRTVVPNPQSLAPFPVDDEIRCVVGERYKMSS